MLLSVGAATLIVILAIGVALAVLVLKGREFDAESKAFVDEAVPSITASWSAEALLARATPELRANVDADKLRSLFASFAWLGHLQQYEGSAGEATILLIIGRGDSVSAAYLARARFSNGEAAIRIVLVRRHGKWMINNFHLDPLPASDVKGS